MTTIQAEAPTQKKAPLSPIQDGKIRCFNPRTGAVIGEIPVTPLAQIPVMVKKAREAQVGWAALGYAGRRRAMSAVSQYMLDHIDQIASELAEENGKTRYEALLMEILGAIDFVSWFAKAAPRALRDRSVPLHFNPMARSYLTYKPVGVVGVIAPWNYPLLTPISDIAPALAAGNAVIFKPSEFSSKVGQLIERMFREAGFPEGVLQGIYGAGDVGAALIRSGVNHIGFTGSTATGKKVMATAAENLTPVTLELGGKDPAIVRPDADLKEAASGILWGGLSNMGQTCASVERVYVHESIYDSFRDTLLSEARKLTCQADQEYSQLGAMNNALQASKVKAQLEDAAKRGAKVAFQVETPKNDGFYAPPTILENCSDDMDVCKEETFGPVIPLLKYKDDEDVIRRCNDSVYGLTASVWTTNHAAGEELARRLHAGVVTINDHMITPGFAEAPWGGVKESGIGRIKSEEALRGYSEVKYIYHDRGLLPFKAWRFPYTPAKMEFLKNLAIAMNDQSLIKRAVALFKVLPAFVFGVKDESK